MQLQRRDTMARNFDENEDLTPDLSNIEDIVHDLLETNQKFQIENPQILEECLKYIGITD